MRIKQKGYKSQKLKEKSKKQQVQAIKTFIEGQKYIGKLAD